MAELSARRVTVIAAVAAALAGGAVAAGVAMVANAGGQTTTASASAAGGLATAAVVRTTLTNAVQVGGSIGYGGSYTIVAPAGTSAQQVVQAQQAVNQDQQALGADEQTESDAWSGDTKTVAADKAAVDAASGTLRSDRTSKAKDCGGQRHFTPACTQDAQKIGQDQTQLTQADQQLLSAESTSTLDHDQNAGKVGSDEAKLQGDQASLALLVPTAINPGTTYTSLPRAGDIIKQDQPVYSLSGQPVPLLYGAIAAYRAFRASMADGGDVGELTHDLISLGYGAGLTQSNHYSSATVAAVKRWQRARGLPATGAILLGEVVFEPGPLRVTSVTPSVGSSVAGGSGGAISGGGGGGGGGDTVLTATSTRPIVTLDLDVTQEYLVKPGDPVSIVLPDGTSTVGGHIETVGNVAVCPGGGGIGTGSGAGSNGSSADQSPCSSTGSGGGSNPSPTVTVTIALDRTPAGTTPDQAPVNVKITTQRVGNVLAVPVNALLALQGGGFGVDVVSGARSRLVGVSTGLYSNTLVQISGAGITAGTRVEVPSS